MHLTGKVLMSPPEEDEAAATAQKTSETSSCVFGGVVWKYLGVKTSREHFKLLISVIVLPDDSSICNVQDLGAQFDFLGHRENLS